MGPDANEKTGIALLEEVERRITQLYGNSAASPPNPKYDPVYDIDNKDLQKQLDLAEKALGDFPQGLAYLSFLRGRLVALKHSPVNNRAMLKCAEHYQKALDLGYSELSVRYYWGLHNIAWEMREQAIGQLSRAVELAGVDSEWGIETAKALEKAKAIDVKKGGCFIATAVYGSESAKEVLVLRSFRDNVLQCSSGGRAFVHCYYFLSPPVARLLSRSALMRVLVGECLLRPVVKICRSVLAGTCRSR